MEKHEQLAAQHFPQHLTEESKRNLKAKLNRKVSKYSPLGGK